MDLTFLAVIVLVASGSVIMIGDEWRLRLLFLVLQYAATAVLLSVEVFPALGFVRFVAGAISAIILFQSFRQAGESLIVVQGREPAISSLLTRVASVLFATIISLGLAQTYPLPDFPRNVTIAVYWLIVSAMASLVLSRDTSRTGFALLMLELAAALLVGVMVETANLARFLLASLSSIVLALAVGFLVDLERRALRSGEVES